MLNHSLLEATGWSGHCFQETAHGQELSLNREAAMVKKGSTAAASWSPLKMLHSAAGQPPNIARCLFWAGLTLVSRQLPRLHPTAQPMVAILGLALCSSL